MFINASKTKLALYYSRYMIVHAGANILEGHYGKRQLNMTIQFFLEERTVEFRSSFRQL